MGKIVKAASVTDTAYVVHVPRIESEAPVAAAHEADERFASPFIDERDAFSERPSEHGGMLVEESRVDWAAVRGDAEALIDRAATDAQALLEHAERAALELLERADVQVAELESQARERGAADGRAAAQEEARLQLEPELATLRGLISGVRAQREAMFAAAEPEMVRLALDVAERVVHTEVGSNPNVVVENVRQAVARVLAREVVTLRVNPADIEVIRHHRDAIVASSDIEHLRVVEDQRVDRGGVLVETESGTIDAKITTQLREARRAIVNDDSIALGPSAEGELHPPAQAS